MKLTFYGGVQTVTGSMHVLEVDGIRILMDCGLFQGKRKEAFEKNSSFPFDPSSLHVMILSHAHIDHSGNIPSLVARGFNGNIFTTSATRDLCAVMLRDSAHIQEKDAEFVNKLHARRGEPSIQPLYRIEDAERCMKNFVGIGYDRWFHADHKVKGYFYDAGHILGSALTLFEIENGGKTVRLLFTGDLGRAHLPILRDPVLLSDIDYLIIESTYGNRVQDNFEGMENRLQDIVMRTYERKGKIIIPAFSVGRTQVIVYSLHNLFRAGKLPSLPIYVDSPLSTNVTEVFKLHPECFDEAAIAMLAHDEDPFGFKLVHYTASVEESKALNQINTPCIIISASGMCEAGRILHHLRNNIEDSKNTILIVGYQAENTLGKRLVDKQKTVRIFGEEHRVRAEVQVLNGYSAHADKLDLQHYLSQTNGRLKKLFVVHGDPDQSQALADAARGMGIKEAYTPHPGQEFPL